MERNETTARPWPDPPELEHAPAQFRLGYRQAQQDAVAEIERLRAENARMKEALVRIVREADAVRAPIVVALARAALAPETQAHE